MPTNSIFRKEKSDANLEPRKPMDTLRPPANVPFVVDNLWAWTRPDGFPDRRKAVFASPRADLAELHDIPDGIVYRVHITDNPCIAQIKKRDARDHPDCKDLPKLLFKFLGDEWRSSEIEKKTPAGKLWMPCLTQKEVEAVFRESELAPYRDEVFAAVTYWKNALKVTLGSDFPYENGEIFFTADSWHLSKMQNCVLVG